MFPNLNAELSRNGVRKRILAKTLGVAETTIYRKLSGEIPLTLTECKKIRNQHLPEFRLEYLFAEEGEEHEVKNGNYY